LEIFAGHPPPDGGCRTRVLVTGVTGFVGRVLCDQLSQAGYLVRAALRVDRPMPANVSERVTIGDIGSTTDWRQALIGVDLVIHLAARAHILHDAPGNADLYAETNARGTARLAEASADAGVGRFVYLSSIKVSGEETKGRAYAASDEPSPQDAYGVSKWLGEQAVMKIGAATEMETIIVRSPLVYGPNVRANFLRLMRWVDEEWPLPLGAIENSRSLVSIWNLCDFLLHVSKHAAAPGRIWMVSDGEDLSTPELIRRLAAAMHRRVRLLPVPPRLLQLAGGLLGRKAEVARLCGSLAVDIAQTRRETGWSPPITVDEAIARTVEWYSHAFAMRS
jgi:nucleoside-diphosphate-sugar epimerase